MKWPFLFILISLTACGQTAAQKAEKSYGIISDDAFGRRDRCTMAGRVKQAYLDEGNKTKYDLWQSTEYADCSRADRGV